MGRVPRQSYSLEFTEEAVPLVVIGDLNVAKVGRRFCFSPRRWASDCPAIGREVAGSYMLEGIDLLPGWKSSPLLRK